jgi:glycosyltransferase involved in cell wall biosynthesis
VSENGPGSRAVLFFSSMADDPWGGSEELWSRAALELVDRRFRVSASVVHRSPLHPRILDLIAAGIKVNTRPQHYSWLAQPYRRIRVRGITPDELELCRMIGSERPDLVVLSDGHALPPVQLTEMCVAKDVQFVTIGQASSETWWYPDWIAERYRATLEKARRCYFVSETNRRLSEKQIGRELPSSEVVHNPFNVDMNESPPWPSAPNDEFRFASVARLHPPTKGQDILLEALATTRWRTRRWRLNLYGEGHMRDVLERLVAKLDLADRVTFAGFAAVKDIWAANHVLVMPSRVEGLPLAMVEAMLCGRPVVATDIAGHSELVQDGRTGFLAEAPTVKAFAAALERFWLARHQAEALGECASQRVRNLFPAKPERVFADKLALLMRVQR